MKYSVAIRTLGTSPETLRLELVSIYSQTIQPEDVIIYIAEGYNRPNFQVGNEKYVWVKKGMVAQRALKYDEISSEYILTLDDDVELSPDFAQILLSEIKAHSAGIVGADIFKNHNLTLPQKLKAIFSNLVFPHHFSKYAFKIYKNGSFSYICNPQNRYYPTQSCGGPAILWEKRILTNLNLTDECWLDNLGFAYGEDQIISYKAYRNGYNLGICFNAKIKNLDAKSDSNKYHNSPDKFLIRTKAMFIGWWRSNYKPNGNNSSGDKTALFAGILKFIWLFWIIGIISIIKFDSNFVSSYLKGITEGLQFIKSKEFNSIPSYIIKNGLNHNSNI